MNQSQVIEVESGDSGRKSVSLETPHAAKEEAQATPAEIGSSSRIATSCGDLERTNILLALSGTEIT